MRICVLYGSLFVNINFRLEKYVVLCVFVVCIYAFCVGHVCYTVSDVGHSYVQVI